MRKFVLGLAFSAFAIPAVATIWRVGLYASVCAPIVPIFSWTGCYIGADIGGAMSDQDVSEHPPRQSPVKLALPGLSANNFIGGGYAGRNYQWSPAWVIGIEGTTQGWIVHTVVRRLPRPRLDWCRGIRWTSTLDSFFCDIARRIGHLWTPGLLFLATGGGAWGRSSYSSADAFFGGCPLCGASSSATLHRATSSAPAWIGHRGSITGSSEPNTSIIIQRCDGLPSSRHLVRGGQSCVE
jgi:outer membrane immunogenic protein